MNRLPLDKRIQIISLLVEGSSLRAASRISGCSINTVTKLLVDVGQACQAFHDEAMYGIKSQRIQCDEIWSFVYAKDKNAPSDMKEGGKAGDIWTWTAIDAETKLIVSWYVGNRDADSAYCFMKDVAMRLDNRVQLTTDGHHAYLSAIHGAFGSKIDYGQLIKMYGNTGLATTQKRYSPADCTGIQKKKVKGSPDYKHISTSYVERQNLTMRMHMRRFTRLTNAFSKKLDNHCHAIALHFVYYNFVRVHKTLRVTPAMEAGLTKELHNIEWLVNLTDPEFFHKQEFPAPKKELTQEELKKKLLESDDW